MNKKKFNISKGIGIAACITIATTGAVMATSGLINKFGNNTSEGVQIAVDNNYYSDINTVYKNANGISTNIDSFLIDDNNFDLNINIEFDSNYNLQNMLANEGNIDIMDLKVVNEKNEKVFATRELEAEEMTSLYKNEKEAKEKYDNYSGSYSSIPEKISDNKIKYSLTATGTHFPVSQKLKITFNKIRNSYWENGEEKYIIYTGEWNFDIDVPEKMAKSNIVKYKLVSTSNQNYIFEDAYVSNTAFKIYLKNCKDIAWNKNECVENENGEKFYPAHRSDGDGEISTDKNGQATYYNTFNLTNYNATDTIKVHLYNTNGEEIIINLKKE